jgi:F-type H+-transporting ATPase subunit delta
MSASIARRYAKAIFAIAKGQGRLEQTGVELDALANLASDPELEAIVSNPILGDKSRQAIARTFADQLQLDPMTRNFIFVLADHKRLDQLVGVADHYRRFVDLSLGRTRADIVSAGELRADDRRALVAALEKLTGKTVLATERVDPELLGGLVVEIHGKVYDGSVQTQLQRLAASIAGRQSFL